MFFSFVENLTLIRRYYNHKWVEISFYKLDSKDKLNLKFTFGDAMISIMKEHLYNYVVVCKIIKQGCICFIYVEELLT